MKLLFMLMLILSIRMNEPSFLLMLCIHIY